jgi:protease-4
MKEFFKYLLASILGIIIASLILFIIFLGVIGGIMSSQDKAISIGANTILHLKLDQPINDRKNPMPMFVYNLDIIGADYPIGLNDVLNNLHKAQRDENIRGIYLELSGLQTGIATVEEIRNALIEFKKSGKFIVAFADVFTQGSYYLASVADKIYLNPQGSLNFIGMSARIMFYKKTLDKLELKPEIIRHGKFKSAIEPLIYEKMSAENREQIRKYMGSIWEHMVNQIADSRQINADNLNEFADNLLMLDNAEAVRYHLVDTLLYRDQVLDTLARLVKADNIKKMKFVSHNRYLRVPEPRDDKGYSRNKIAVIYASGEVLPGEAGEGSIGAGRISRAIREARMDSSVKAIVFRVNSPGGSALASEVIWRELNMARQVKPVIASMGDVAASGGYYIVAAADTIVASPVTITGSIGVFGVLLNAADFLENKLGITTDVEKTNAFSDFATIYRPMSATERNAVQKMVDGFYSTFVERVADGRDLAYSDVDKLGEGRVWSGKNALELRLVDLSGGLSKAIEVAVEKAGVVNYRIMELPRLQDPLTQILKELSDDWQEKSLRRELSPYFRQYKALKQLLENDRIQARLPFDITIQ